MHRLIAPALCVAPAPDADTARVPDPFGRALLDDTDTDAEGMEAVGPGPEVPPGGGGIMTEEELADVSM